MAFGLREPARVLMMFVDGSTVLVAATAQMLGSFKTLSGVEKCVESHGVNGCFSVFELDTERQDLWCPSKFVSRLVVTGLK